MHTVDDDCPNTSAIYFLDRLTILRARSSTSCSAGEDVSVENDPDEDEEDPEVGEDMDRQDFEGNDDTYQEDSQVSSGAEDRSILVDYSITDTRKRITKTRMHLSQNSSRSDRMSSDTSVAHRV